MEGDLANLLGRLDSENIRDHLVDPQDERMEGVHVNDDLVRHQQFPKIKAGRLFSRRPSNFYAGRTAVLNADHPH